MMLWYADNADDDDGSDTAVDDGRDIKSSNISSAKTTFQMCTSLDIKGENIHIALWDLERIRSQRVEQWVERETNIKALREIETV